MLIVRVAWRAREIHTYIYIYIYMAAVRGRYRWINSVPLLNRAKPPGSTQHQDCPSHRVHLTSGSTRTARIPSVLYCLHEPCANTYVPNLSVHCRCRVWRGDRYSSGPMVMSRGVRFDLAVFVVYQTLCLSRGASLQFRTVGSSRARGLNRAPATTTMASSISLNSG